MVRYNKKRFLTHSKPFGFHGGSDHLEGLACAHFVCQQRIAAVENVGNSVKLMLSQSDFRVHAGEGDVTAVILSGTGGIEKLIVPCDQIMPPVRVFPYPVAESIFDCLLLLLCEGGFLAVQHTALLAVRIVLGIVDTHITEI